MLYYSGHGAVLSGHMCMIGVDFDGNTDCEGSKASVENIINKITINARGCRLIVILDMCRSFLSSAYHQLIINRRASAEL
jgi:hypothetical protein